MDRVYILAGCQISGGRSNVGSNFPRKIGKGMPHILGFLEGGCRYFCDSGPNVGHSLYYSHCSIRKDSNILSYELLQVASTGIAGWLDPPTKWNPGSIPPRIDGPPVQWTQNRCCPMSVQCKYSCRYAFTMIGECDCKCNIKSYEGATVAPPN